MTYLNLSNSKFCISPKEIEVKGKSWDFQSINYLRWGSKGVSELFASNSTIYIIEFGNIIDKSSIILQRIDVYNNIIDRIWKTVGIRLLTELLEELRNGESYQFGNVIIKDFGVEFKLKKKISKNKQIFCNWKNIEIYNGNDFLFLKKKTDTNLSASLSYHEANNVFILQIAIRMLKKYDGERLSSLLKY